MLSKMREMRGILPTLEYATQYDVFEGLSRVAQGVAGTRGRHDLGAVLPARVLHDCVCQCACCCYRFRPC